MDLDLQSNLLPNAMLLLKKRLQLLVVPELLSTQSRNASFPKLLGTENQESRTVSQVLLSKVKLFFFSESDLSAFSLTLHSMAISDGGCASCDASIHAFFDGDKCWLVVATQGFSNHFEQPRISYLPQQLAKGVGAAVFHQKRITPDQRQKDPRKFVVELESSYYSKLFQDCFKGISSGNQELDEMFSQVIQAAKDRDIKLRFIHSSGATLAEKAFKSKRSLRWVTGGSQLWLTLKFGE